MVPFVELRGAIPLAIAAGYDLVSVFTICVMLNLLIIPIAFIVLDFILPPIRRRVKFVDYTFQWFVKRAHKHRRLSLIGLAAFVGIPLPVTGAYTGALIAYTADIDRKRAAVAIAAGVVTAGILIWVLATLGIFWIREISP
jgi:uncharacterized membrane protein